MDNGSLSTNMKTILADRVDTQQSEDFLTPHRAQIKPKPKKPRSTPTFIDPNINTSPLDLAKTEKLAPEVAPELTERLKKEKEELLRIRDALDTARLNLYDSGGQGFLINASATITAYVRNTYK